jgi:hypothetical protein
MTKSLKIDLAVVIGIILLAIPLALIIQPRPFALMLLFFVLPSLYLLFRKPKPLKRILTASILFGTLFSFPFAFIASLNQTWAEPAGQLILDYRILDVLPIEYIVWSFFWILLIVVFYEHFIEQDISGEISHNYKYGLIPALFNIILTVILFLFKPDVLRFSYAYLLLGLGTLLPVLYLIFKKPLLFLKFLKVSIFFFFLYTAFEYTVLKLGQRSFPGEYIGGIKFLGMEFPFEEFLFWILLSSTVVLSYYELYIDDQK